MTPIRFLQGASPADVAQRLSRSAVAGAVADDRQGLASLTPLGPGQAGPWGPLDISSTPNRLLQSRLQLQVRGRTLTSLLLFPFADTIRVCNCRCIAFAILRGVRHRARRWSPTSRGCS